MNDIAANVERMTRAGLETTKLSNYMNDIKNIETSQTTEPGMGYTNCCALVPSVVYNEDCIEGLKRFSDNYFDLAIVDPPYGLKISNSEYLGNTKNDKRWAGREKGYRHKPKDWDNEIPNEKYWNELRRVSKNQIVWGWNYFVQYFNECPSYIVWNKETSGNYSDCEMAYCSIKGTNKIFTWLWNGFRKQRPEERIHPTQKPVALYEWILQNYASEGDLILDTHVGSGSIRIACDKGGFNFTGFEIDKDYWEAQEKRFSDYKRQLRLF